MVQMPRPKVRPCYLTIKTAVASSHAACHDVCIFPLGDPFFSRENVVFFAGKPHAVVLTQCSNNSNCVLVALEIAYPRRLVQCPSSDFFEYFVFINILWSRSRLQQGFEAT